MKIPSKKLITDVSDTFTNPFVLLDSQQEANSAAILNEAEKKIRPEDWHNIPKCVVEATRYLLDRQKFQDTKISHQL